MQLSIDEEIYTSKCSRVCLRDRERAVLNARRVELHPVFFKRFFKISGGIISFLFKHLLP